ncbi:MAG TPA: metal-dependent hydrolase [Candidatus Bathyarchaeia archaeon]|nr:metal-dependent hydrolase [Candidatus Bathyarchaeia archaeon]
MPYTWYHIGFAVLLFSLIPYIDPIAIILGTVLIDIEGVLYLLFKIGVEHGYSHSLLGVMIYCLPCVFFSWLFYFVLGKITKRSYNFKWYLSLISGIVGLLSHIFFDGSLYPEMKVLYPFSKNTGLLYGLMSYRTAVIILTVMFFGGILILLVKIILKNKIKIIKMIFYNFPPKVTDVQETKILEESAIQSDV